jgi:putative membrane protein
MSVLAQVFVGLAAALHVLFFVMESVVFMRPDVHRRFGLRTREEAELVRPMAYNQGFYNLFLAVGAVVGLVWAAGDGSDTGGTAVAGFACAVMLGAAVVLVTTGRRFLPAAMVQGVPPLLALVLIVS